MGDGRRPIACSCDNGRIGYTGRRSEAQLRRVVRDVVHRIREERLFRLTRSRRSDFIASTNALFLVDMNLGIAIVARIPIITITTRCSMRVKPGRRWLGMRGSVGAVRLPWMVQREVCAEVCSVAAVCAVTSLTHRRAFGNTLSPHLQEPDAECTLRPARACSHTLDCSAPWCAAVSAA